MKPKARKHTTVLAYGVYSSRLTKEQTQIQDSLNVLGTLSSRLTKEQTQIQYFLKRAKQWVWENAEKISKLRKSGSTLNFRGNYS